MNIIETGVRSQQSRAFGIDPTAPRAEVEDHVIEVERHLKIRNCLAIELRTQASFIPIHTRERNRSERWKQFATRNSNRRGLRPRAFPGEALVSGLCP